MEKANECSKEGCDKREAEASEAKQRDTRRKRQKAEAVPPCVKCGGRQMLSMCARSCDGNSYTLPNGESEQGCYMGLHLRRRDGGQGVRRLRHDRGL